MGPPAPPAPCGHQATAQRNPGDPSSSAPALSRLMWSFLFSVEHFTSSVLVTKSLPQLLFFSYRTKKAVRETNRLFSVRGTEGEKPEETEIRQKAQKRSKLLNQRPRNIGHFSDFQFVRKQMVKFELA